MTRRIYLPDGGYWADVTAQSDRSAPTGDTPTGSTPAGGAAPEVDLPAEVARRLRDVLRLRPGDVLRLFDGAGRERAAELAAVDRRRVRVRLGPVVAPPVADPARPLWLACAFPRGQRGDWLVEKATELGVWGFVAARAERAVLDPGAGRVERWRRLAAESAEICGRARLPLFADAPPERALHLVCEPGTAQPPEAAITAAARAGRADGPVVLHIGPEGGWTADELAAFAARGVVAVGLGPRLLRVETAAIVAAARVMHALEGEARPAAPAPPAPRPAPGSATG